MSGRDVSLLWFISSPRRSLLVISRMSAERSRSRFLLKLSSRSFGNAKCEIDSILFPPTSNLHERC
jgi:hypothetical protein